MKTADILSQVVQIRDGIPEDFRTYDAVRQCNSLIAMLGKQIRQETAATPKARNAVKYIECMCEDMRKQKREPLSYPWIDTESRQCVCDGFRAYRLIEHLPLPERPANAGDPIDLNKIVPSSVERMQSMPVPDFADLKAFITVETAKHKGEKRNKYLRPTAPIWDFGDGLPACNAQYLLEFLTVMQDVKCIWYDPNRCTAPLYIVGSNGDGVLCPVKKNA